MPPSEPTSDGPAAPSVLRPGQPGQVAEARAAAFDLVRGWLFSDAMARLLSPFAELDSASDPGTATEDWLHLNEELPGWLDQLVAGDDPRLDHG
ncbi:MAG: hypothetical protein ABI140_05930 [Jatrophihabitantaceae bacterium]